MMGMGTGMGALERERERKPKKTYPSAHTIRTVATLDTYGARSMRCVWCECGSFI